MNILKQQLYKQCLDHIQQRIDDAQFAIDEIHEATTEDTKSSAGDKYETSREMMQQETDRNMAQLAEANKLKVALNQISDSGTSATAETGSVVLTGNGNFYLAVSAGILMVDNERYFAVSPASPIGLQLKGLKKGDEFSLNGKLYHINLVI